jgi:hypothetical protein
MIDTFGFFFIDDKYPYLSSIVQHHMRPVPNLYPHGSNINTGMIVNTGPRPTRYDTSTTTLNEHVQQEHRPGRFVDASTLPHEQGQRWEPQPGRFVDASMISLEQGQRREPQPGRFVDASTVSHEKGQREPQPGRFIDASMISLEQGQRREPQPDRFVDASTTSAKINVQHDGHIRPISPARPTVVPDSGIIRVGLNISAGPSYGPAMTSLGRDSPTIYRSSTTIYTRDRNHHVDLGEARTWTPVQTGVNNEHAGSLRKPYVHVEIGRMPDQHVPSARIDNKRETHSQHSTTDRTKQHNIDDEQEIQEEQYEVTYAYERQVDEYSYDGGKYSDEIHRNARKKNIADEQSELFGFVTIV